MAVANRTWGEERIAAELLLKLGIRVSPRTVRRYLPSRPVPGTRTNAQAWSTFVRNHARAVLACDFCVAVSATFRVFYVQANAYCERLIGTIRRECLDWVIPLGERQLRHILKAWVAHYNGGRPHASLGPGIPASTSAPIGERSDRHRLPVGDRVTATSILGGRHHEYRLPACAMESSAGVRACE
jgi:hypothetical protein